MSQLSSESENTPIYERLKRKMELKYSGNVDSTLSYQEKVQSAQKDFESLTEEQKQIIVDFDINEKDNTKLSFVESDKCTPQDDKEYMCFNINKEFDAEATSPIHDHNNSSPFSAIEMSQHVDLTTNFDSSTNIPPQMSYIPSQPSTESPNSTNSTGYTSESSSEVEIVKVCTPHKVTLRRSSSNSYSEDSLDAILNNSIEKVEIDTNNFDVNESSPTSIQSSESCLSKKNLKKPRRSPSSAKSLTPSRSVHSNKIKLCLPIQEKEKSDLTISSPLKIDSKHDDGSTSIQNHKNGSTINLSQNTIKSDSSISLKSSNEMFSNTKSHHFTHQLQNYIDETCDTLYGEWEPKLLMDMKCDNEVIPNYDILTYVGDSSFKGLPTLIHFCPDKYPVHPLPPHKIGKKGEGDAFKGKGFESLFHDIKNLCVAQGFDVIKNQEYILQGRNAQRIVCDRGVPYKGNPDKRKELEYRTQTLCNDRKNSRGKKGLNLPRKRTVKRPLTKDLCCSFRFCISMTDEYFYVVKGIGVRKHCKHQKLQAEQYNFPAKLLKQAEKELIHDIARTGTSATVSVNAIYEKTGKIITPSNVRYLKGLLNEKTLDNMEPQNTTESMIAYLKKKGYDHMLLLDDGKGGKLQNQVEKNLGLTSTPNNFEPEDQNDAMYFLDSHRKKYKVEPGTQMMIAIAWVLKSEKRLTNLFPEIFMVDTVGDTNNEKRPLLTITGKDSNGQMFTVLRAFLPNEKAWAFNWIFSVVLPTLLGSTLMQRVNHVICDGDPQEYQQIDAAIKRHFPQATRGRCGFHLITLGWKRCMSSKKTYNNNKTLYDAVSKQLKSWMYSWMKPDCLTKSEYELSKNLFFQFLNSQEIREGLGQIFIHDVTKFVRESVLPQEAYYCFYLRKNSRHFDEYSNSSHEGTNNAMKNCSSPVKPSHNLEKSMTILSKQGERSVAKKKRLYNNSNDRHKVFSSLKCTDKLTPIAAEILERAWMGRVHIKVIRVAPHLFLAIYTNQEVIKRLAKTSITPKFMRVYRIIHEHNYLLCSCNKFERKGIPCSHQYAVASLSNTYGGPNHHDVSIRWWNLFFQFGWRDEFETEYANKLTACMELLKNHDTKGIRMNKAYFINVPISDITPEFTYSESIPVCLNFKLMETENYSMGLTPGYNEVVFQDSNDATTNLFQTSHIIEDIAQRLKTSSEEDKVAPYSYLLPGFKEMCKKMPRQMTKKQLRHHLNWMTDVGLAYESEDIDRIKKTLKDGKTKIVSCALPRYDTKKTYHSKHM